MTSVRLPLNIEEKLRALAARRGASKSEVIKEALEKMFASEDLEKDSFELGQNYFGKYGSGQKNLSKEYKRILKDKLRAKHHSH